MNTTGSASSAFPRAMSTQHPDNVAVPFFASGPVMNGEDEVREAYYAFSHLGCDEQMWDFEGKEVDEFVVEKLLSSYETFFRERPLGDAVRLTPRVPNPALEKAQAKVLLESSVTRSPSIRAWAKALRGRSARSIAAGVRSRAYTYGPTQ